MVPNDINYIISTQRICKNRKFTSTKANFCILMKQTNV